MLIDEYWWLLMLIDDYWCLLMFIDAYWWLLMFIDVYGWLLMVIDVYCIYWWFIDDDVSMDVYIYIYIFWWCEDGCSLVFIYWCSWMFLCIDGLLMFIGFEMASLAAIYLLGGWLAGSKNRLHHSHGNMWPFQQISINWRDPNFWWLNLTNWLLNSH
jgi:hypothetical protein